MNEKKLTNGMQMDTAQPEIIKSGVAALVGPPNVGKSTLLNTILGQKISIVTPKPQTTRNRIAGVLNGEGYQIVLLDTPGLHRSTLLLNQEMVKVALDSLQGVEAVIFMIDASRSQEATQNLSRQEEYRDYLETVECPAYLLLNKIDLIDRETLLPIIDFYAKMYPFKGVIPVSALKGDGLDRLIEELVALMPQGFRYFPEDVRGISSRNSKLTVTSSPIKFRTFCRTVSSSKATFVSFTIRTINSSRRSCTSWAWATPGVFATSSTVSAAPETSFPDGDTRKSVTRPAATSSRGRPRPQAHVPVLSRDVARR